jgi:hypothetical protein
MHALQLGQLHNSSCFVSHVHLPAPMRNALVGECRCGPASTALVRVASQHTRPSLIFTTAAYFNIDRQICRPRATSRAKSDPCVFLRWVSNDHVQSHGIRKADGVADGGGVRGLVTLLMLRRLMFLIDPKNPPKPCRVFDVIAGTSTGGLLAIMLGRLVSLLVPVRDLTLTQQ